MRGRLRRVGVGLPFDFVRGRCAVHRAGHRAMPGIALALLAAQAAQAAEPLTVCMAEDNPPLSYQVKGEDRGLDVRIAGAVADEVGRPLRIVFFESKYERETTLSQEVNALLSSGVCELASGYLEVVGVLKAFQVHQRAGDQC